ncbi:MAG: hypothetical protein O2819_00185 [Planctomycetota bacterium]|nr:hypothetical protein [Planctomycetota bacterium]MDA1105364.1 hypothetical protein [Planctomycetota bacterium]
MRRRRRRRVRASAGDSDSFDLFLDALCCGLGVVMFIVMVVALFAKPPVGGGDAEELKKLESQLAATQTELEATLSALKAIPPAGDPALTKRYKAALLAADESRERRDETLDRISATREVTEERTQELAESEKKQNEELKKQAELAARMEKLKYSTAFVRTSRWNVDDTREAVLLLVSGGLASAPRIDPTATELRPVSGIGEAVRDAETARAAVATLLAGTSPSSKRIEVAVWPDSYGAFKHLERELQDRGFAIQPIPVAAGEALMSGDGGSQ